jgi:hypothetical protein
VYRLSLVGIICGAVVAQAQMPAPAPPTPTPLPVSPPLLVQDSVPSFERPNGSLLRVGTLTYQLSLRRPDGQIVPLGARSVSVSDASLGGAPGWLIAEARTGTVVGTTDSVYLARADLTPERWAATIGRSQLGASFSHDSIFGAVQTYQGRASFAIALPPDALLSAGMIERVVELLPLRVGYRAAATLLLVEDSSPRPVLAELRVDREERTDVGGRSVDCWLVALRAGALEERLWVAKDGARVVRTEQALAGGLLSALLQP